MEILYEQGENAKNLIKELRKFIHPDQINKSFPWDEHTPEGVRMREVFAVLTSNNLLDNNGKLNPEMAKHLMEAVEYIYPTFKFLNDIQEEEEFYSCEPELQSNVAQMCAQWKTMLETIMTQNRVLGLELLEKEKYLDQLKKQNATLLRNLWFDAET